MAGISIWHTWSTLAGSGAAETAGTSAAAAATAANVDVFWNYKEASVGSEASFYCRPLGVKFEVGPYLGLKTICLPQRVQRVK
jgi:hypothetical protein